MRQRACRCLDRELVESALRDHDVTGVIHVAGYKYAGVSVQRPLHTYEQNVDGTRVVLAAGRCACAGRVSLNQRGSCAQSDTRAHVLRG
ncbi:NAD-dependent epimerase/dehydratase family protein [Ralstonia pickettii]|uniref:NAD-dependent epimerase/dehydratase family protein n=1 Tax=Ralstonia pickettii TaxID=329 RepID=UPI0034D35C6E